MPIISDYEFPWEITLEEASWILTAMQRKFLFSNSQTLILCSHTLDRDFLQKHDDLFHHHDFKPKNNSVLLKSLYKNFCILAEKNSDFESQSKKFRDITEDMPYKAILMLSSSFLIDYHEKTECSKYLSLALKFYLKAFQVKSLTYPFEKHPKINAENMLSYLKYISSHRCQYEVFKGYLDFFLGIIFRQPLAFEDPFLPVLSSVFEIANEFCFNVLGEIFQQGKFNQFTRRSVIQNLDRFLFLVNYGLEDQRHEKSLREYKKAIVDTDRNDIFDINGICICAPLRFSYRFRSFQVLYLFVKSIYDESEEANKPKQSLKILWSSVPDPFLIKKEFLASFNSLNHDVRTDLCQAWQWYEQNIRTEVNVNEKSPRTLKHLSRIAIRRGLTACGQTPFGIQYLEIPATLKAYVDLKD